VHGHVVRGYPALVVEGGDVALRVLATAAEAGAAHPAGVRRLLLLDVGLAPARVTSRWSGAEALTLAAGPHRTTEALVEDVQAAAIAALTAGEDLGAVRDPAAYAALVARVGPGLEDEVRRVVGDVVRALAASRELDAAIRSATSMALLATVSDVRAQQRRLVPAGFANETPPERLRDLPRYLRGATARLTKAAESPVRDADLAGRIRLLEEALAATRATVEAGPVDPARLARAEEVRWLLEELRVSFFAQHLGTSTPVSEKRVTRAIAAI